MALIIEGKASIEVNPAKVVSKKMEVFYNPLMELNRSVSVLLLNSIGKKGMQIALPLAGTGVRGIRFLKELDKGIIKSVCMNDYSKKAVSSIKKNLKLNKISSKVKVSMNDANLFLLNSKGFDYIDIDPFGSPNPFLYSSAKRLSRNSILAVTATDTSSLAGSHIKACIRKYWAMPLRTAIMHEIGLRILIRKCQLIAAQYDKALVPVYSYSSDHYLRVYMECRKGKSHVDSVLKMHGFHENAGPLWLGSLWNTKIAEAVFGLNKEQKYAKFLKTISEESPIDSVGFYHLPSLASRHGNMPRIGQLISELKSRGFKAARTHFMENSIRSNVPYEGLIEITEKLKFKA